MPTTSEAPLVKACHRISVDEEIKLARRCCANGMAVLVPVDRLARDQKGKSVRGGLFGVKHKPDTDRLINDRRPFNAMERRLRWASLPHGACFVQLVVGPDQHVRGSGDDLRTFFYYLAHLDAWLPRNAVGRDLAGSRFTDMGYDADQTYALAFRVVCMGDGNAVDTAQLTHEALLRKYGCMDAEEALQYLSAFPRGDTIEGVYIDGRPLGGSGLHRAPARVWAFEG